MSKRIDCVVCGSCVVDVLVHPVDLHQPIGAGRLVRTESLMLTTGGIVSNAGITLARLGKRVAAMTYVGDDAWAEVVRERYQSEGIDTKYLQIHPSAPTSTTAVMINESGERSFLHAVGAPKKLDKQVFLSLLDLFADSHFMLLGYFPLLPNLLEDLPSVLQAIQQVGCKTALDSAGEGGSLDQLQPSLPFLDCYVPSLAEAKHQTGENDPERILTAYREAGAAGLVGVKLGEDGALLSASRDDYLEVAPVKAPAVVVDTTGAGDCFFGGLLTGLLRGLDLADAGKLASAAGACCVTGLGATTAVRNYEQTCRLAGIES